MSIFAAMVRRLVTLIAVIAIAIVSVATVAHAARVPADPGMAQGHVTAAAAADAHDCCPDTPTRQPPHDALCALSCAGLVGNLPVEPDQPARAPALVQPPLLPAALARGLSPGSDERPPRAPLL
ncbi:hypothetical protein [Albidovulum sediminis]|uniref:CopL family metal-binding regulatory protein n=1 Tax=Albidovulum sediminis TaxID=3066345 RepID=A0ABT2NNM0_9RHOB|nr:hypothetical protein [Defluviimonas sediminis]MCT8329549.1 hypothetical protein [Defluviimonas sediminis]